LDYADASGWSGSVSTEAGTGGASVAGQRGTLWLADDALLSSSVVGTGWRVYGIGAWSPASLAMSGAAALSFEEPGFALTVAGDAVIDGSALSFGVNGSSDPAAATFGVGGSLLLTNAASLVLYGGNATQNGAVTNYGAAVRVTNDLVVASGASVWLYSHPTNGGSALLAMRDFVLESGGRIRADDAGFEGSVAPNGTRAYGPGGGYTFQDGGGGGSYGGRGRGRNGAMGYVGVTYGSSNAPAIPGSGGGGANAARGGRGGGLVRIDARGDVTVGGTISANGGNGDSGNTGGGSGGAVYITTGTFKTFSGAGVLEARGGNAGGNSGGGGGGRIAVWRSYHNWTGAPDIGNDGTAVDGGTYDDPSDTGDPGTVVWGQLPLPPAGTVIVIR
jgi:hypothetical protein